MKKDSTEVIGIYQVIAPSGKIYVGQSWRVNGRISGYKRYKLRPKMSKLHSSFNKYGVENHRFEIIYECTELVSQHKLDCLEQFYMDWYRNQGIELLNIREAGSSGKQAQETKEKIGNTRKLKFITDPIFRQNRLIAGRKGGETKKMRFITDPIYRQNRLDAGRKSAQTSTQKREKKARISFTLSLLHSLRSALREFQKK